VRIPQSKVWNIKGSGLNILGCRLRRIAFRSGLYLTNRSLGFDHSGHIDQTVLIQLLNEVKPGITEFIMHPGLDALHLYDWGFCWQKELDALTSNATLQHIKKLNIKLIKYSDVT
jgi:hypothetical protein